MQRAVSTSQLFRLTLDISNNNCHADTTHEKGSEVVECVMSSAADILSRFGPDHQCLIFNAYLRMYVCVRNGVICVCA